MGFYRKKAVVIEARQYRGGPSDYVDLRDWLLSHGKEGAARTSVGMIIPTAVGEHLAREGDWIVRTATGEFYTCKPAFFDQTYEPAE